MCDHQRSVQIDSDGGQASDSSVNSGNKDVFVVNLVLYNPRTLRFARLGMLRYDLEPVKGLADQNRVDCLFAMIGQSDMLSLYGTEDTMCLGHRGLPGKKKTRRRSV